jgi:hypothetical protein
MPSSRRRHRREEQSRLSGPIDFFIYMLSACTLQCQDDSRGKHWDSDDETEVTELSSRSSGRRSKRSSSSRPRSSSKSKKTPRSRSHSVKSRQRSHSFERSYQLDRRARSLSRSQQPRPSATFEPVPSFDLNQNAEIRIYHNDDDVSAISAGTLEQMEKNQILEQANKNLYRRHTPTFSSSKNQLPIIPLESYNMVRQDKENVMNFASPSNKSQGSHFVSHASSDGTSEFESVWNKPTKSNAPIPEMVGNSSSRNHEPLKSSTRRKSHSHHTTYETPNTRKMRRRIQRDGIGTIAEGMYSDEEEI